MHTPDLGLLKAGDSLALKDLFHAFFASIFYSHFAALGRALRNITAEHGKSVREWRKVMTQLAIAYGERFRLEHRIPDTLPSSPHNLI